MNFDYDEHKDKDNELKSILESILNPSRKEAKNDETKEPISESKDVEPTKPDEVDEPLTEGWFDRMVANYRAKKEGSAVDRYNQRLNAKKNVVKRVELDDQGKPNLIAKRTIGQKSKLSRMHEAKINSVTNSMYKDLVRLGIIVDDDVNFKDAISNFIKALSILSIYEHSPMTGKKWSWTEVSRQLMDRYIRPSLEAIANTKRGNQSNP